MKILPDVLTVAGGGVLFYGVHSVYPPAAWIVFGLAGLAAGVLLGRSEK